MSEPTKIESVGYDVEDLAHVQAGEDFRRYTRLCDATILGKSISINGDELEHGNYLPSSFDVLDTARAQFGVPKALDRGGSFSGVPFCCVCGNRECAFIRWKMEVEESGEICWLIEAYDGDKIGEGAYKCSFERIQGLVANLHRQLIDFIGEQDIQTLGGPDSEEHEAKNDYWTRSGLAERRSEISEFELA